MPLPLNPYIAGDPVGNSPAFVGREDLLREVLRVLRSPNQNAITLYGQRRIGKTSFLQWLQVRLPQEGAYRPVFFDLQDKAAWPLGRVLNDLARVIADALELPPPDLGRDPETAFRRDWLPQALAALPPETSLVLLFDEFDVLADPKAEQAVASFFPYLRDLLALDPARLQFVFVLGRNVTDLSSIALSVFKGAPSRRISLLLEKDARKLIRLSEENGSLQWTPEAVDAVWALTHGHPYLTQALCWSVWEQAHEEHDAPPPVRADDVEAAVPAALEAGRNTLEWLWDGLGPAERVVISALAQAGPRTVDEAELERLLRESGVRILIRELQNAPQTLQDWDLIEPADGGYRFRVELLRRWIAAHRPLSRVQDELDRLQPRAENLFQVAYGYYQDGSLEQAEARLREALGFNPNHIKANELLAEILIARGDLNAARDLLEKFYEFNPQATRPRLAQTYLLLARAADDEQSRLEWFEKVIGIQPGDPEARAGLEAIQKLRQEEKELAFRFVEGRQALQRGEWTRAVEHFQWIVQARPQYEYDGALAADLLAQAVREDKARPPRWKILLRQTQTLAFLGGALFLLLISFSYGLGRSAFQAGVENRVGYFGTYAPTITPTFTPGPGATSTPRAADGMVMVFIPAGEFQMGSESGDSDERPVHRVYTDAFWMDRHEVTNAMYRRCVEAGDCSPPSSTNYYDDTQYANAPVVYVNWNQAQAYCAWTGGSLPTEAEWEKAARGGLAGAPYPWGDDPPTCPPGASNGAQYAACSPSGPIDVMTFAHNDYGLYDMAGNVWEWVADWYDSNYYNSLQDGVRNPQGPASGSSRVLRGGSWNNSENDLRVANRSRFAPGNVCNYIGFRCVRSVP